MAREFQISDENQARKAVNAAESIHHPPAEGSWIQDNRQETIAQRQLEHSLLQGSRGQQLMAIQKMADTSPAARQVVQLQKRADHHRTTPGQEVIQRRILFDGKQVEIGKQLSRASDMKERVIIANWDWSQTDHDFVTTKRGTSQDKLDKAVASAKAQVVDVPPLYSASNLMFLTHGSDRLPTLYFKSGNLSGRIRQQHGSGPVVIDQTDKVDYFFPSKDKMDLFYDATADARTKKADFNPDLSTFEATLTPTAGYYHFEVTYKSGRKIAKVHPSGGTVVTNTGGYNDIRIKSIYQGVIGYTT